MKRNLLLGLGLTCAFAGVATASDSYDKRWYLAPGLNYTFTEGSGTDDFDRPADEGLGGSISIGRAISRHLNADLRISGANLNGINGSQNTEHYSFGADLLYFFNRNRIAPYALVGVGVMNTAIGGESTTNAVADLGLGVQAQFADYGASIRAGVNFRVDFFDASADETTEYGELVPSIALVLPLGVDNKFTEHSRDGLKGVDTRWQLGISGLWGIPDTQRDPSTAIEAEPGGGIALSVGRAVSESWNTEFRLYSSKFELEDGPFGGEIDVMGLMVDFQYFFSRNERFSPYAEFGIGAQRSEISGFTSSGPAAEVGFGFISRFNQHGTGIRVGARYRVEPTDYNDSSRGITEFGDVEFHAGIVVPMGPRSDVSPALPSKGLDSDLDGVKDSADRCPNSFPGAVVDAQGCELDSDNDGVVDSADRCPTTPAGAQVGADGCSSDQDRDGVTDAADKCPNTAPGQTVDAEGCAAPEVIIVRFATDSSELDAGDKAKLDVVVRTMVQRSFVVAVVGGHTDSVGSNAYNRGLSKRRASAVRAYLVARGVRPANLTLRGYGEEQPVADNSTAAGRRLNRRVEVRVLNP